MVATSLLAAVIPITSKVVGELIRSQLTPFEVSRMTPLRPTTQHTVLDGAMPASRSADTPVNPGVQLLRSELRYTAPEFCSDQ